MTLIEKAELRAKFYAHYRHRRPSEIAEAWERWESAGFPEGVALFAPTPVNPLMVLSYERLSFRGWPLSGFPKKFGAQLTPNMNAYECHPKSKFHATFIAALRMK